MSRTITNRTDERDELKAAAIARGPSITWKFACMECGKKFRSTRAAERASSVGCPTCNSVDIDVDI